LRKGSEFWPYFFLFVLAAAVYLPVIFSGRTVLVPTYQDKTQWVLYREVVSRSFASGYFPLWCESLYSGLDFAGWGHASAFYPLAFFFFLLEFPAAATWNQSLHLLICLSGFYFLGRKIGLKKPSAFIIAAGYGLVVFGSSMLEDFLPDIFAQAFTPWVYGLSIALADQPRKRSFLVLSLVFGCQWLSGHIEAVVLELLSMLVLMAVYVWLRPVPLEKKISALALWFCAIGFGVVLGIAAYLPSLAGYSQSFRKLGLSYQFFTFFPRHTLYLETLPSWLFFISVISLFCLFLSLGARTRIFWALTVMLVFTLAETYNWFNLLWLFYHIPGLNRFIPHGRALSQALLAVFLLVGMGMDNLSALDDKKSSRLLLIAVLFLEGIYFYFFIKFSGQIGGSPENQQIFLRIIFTRQALCGLAVASGLAGMMLLFSRGMKLSGLIILLQLTLLLEYLVTGLALPSRNDPKLMDPHPEYLQFLKNIDPSQFRIQSVYSFDQWEKLRTPLQTGVLYGTRSPDAYITFSDLRYTEFINRLDDKAMKYREGKVLDIQVLNILKRGDFVSEQKAPLINLLNLKYFIGENKNLKSASAYFIPYEFYRFAPSTNVGQGRSFKELEVYPPARFGVRIYISPGDNLFLETGSAGSTAKFIFELFFEKERGEKTLVYSKAIDAGAKSSISLEPYRNNAGSLSFTILPLSSPVHISLPVKAWMENSKKYFKRLDFKEIDVFENPDALPRAFLVHGVKLVPEKEARLDYLGSKDFDPSQTALLEKELWLKFREKMKMAPNETTQVLEEKAYSQALKIAVRNQSPAVLVLSQVYYPGFRALLDGKETKIFPVDHCFQGVLVAEPGVHKLEIKYQPVSFQIALWTGLSGMLGLIFLSLPLLRKKKVVEPVP